MIQRLRPLFGALIALVFFSFTPYLLAEDSPALAMPVAPSSSVREAKGCPNETRGGTVLEPASRRSKNGTLRVSLSMRSSIDKLGQVHYCYIDELGNEDPTLRVAPGDTLKIELKNDLAAHAAGNKSEERHRDPCTGGRMSEFATNLHFHGLAVPPICHEDETIRTLVEPGDPPFEYRLKIPLTQPPGLYWYHPHVHGFSEEQLLRGASGALIVEGIEKAVPRVVELPERVLVIRDEPMPELSSSENADLNRPTKQLSINHIVVPYPKYPTPQIKLKPLERQLWRVLNASADTYLDLRMEYGSRRQTFEMVALDGVPLHYGEPGAATYAPEETDVLLPPAARAEFVVQGPPKGVSGMLQTSYVFRGALDDDRPVLPTNKDQPALRMGQDDVDSERPLISIVSSSDASAPSEIASSARDLEMPVIPLSGARPVRKRVLYFSEELVDPGDPKSATRFFITEEGHTPKVFDPVKIEPSITVHQGDVEDWTVENRSREVHTFHVHQIHFIVVGARGSWEDPTLRDTVNVPAWTGFGPYPRIIVRMDFRGPDLVGVVPYHCHIAQHLDGGMMGVVRVEPSH